MIPAKLAEVYDRLVAADCADSDDDLEQARAARSLLNRLQAEGKIAMKRVDGSSVLGLFIHRPVRRTVTEWEEMA